MEDEEQPPNDSEEDNPDSQFEFFLEFTKPLVLELPSADDRAVAAAWVQRLETEPETHEERTLRVDYLKLLSFVMQRGLLVGMFKKEPEPAPLPPFPNGFGLAEMGNALLEQADLQASGDTKESQLSYSMEISNDLKEFVAAQEIPNFGVQMYYAWSVEDPIHMWQSYDENKFPPHVREKVKQLKKITSDEKTDLQTYNIQLEKVDCLVRKSYDSESSSKSKIKVKSPQEIERERSSQFEFDFSGSPRKSSTRKNSPEGSSLRMDFTNCLRNKSCCRVQEMGCTTPEGEEDNQVECRPTDDDDECPTGEFRSGTAGSCPQGIRGKSSKKCDDGGEGRYASEHFCSNKRGLRNTDQFGLEMHVDWGGCAADTGEKYHMGACEGFSPTTANRMKSKCFSPADTGCQKSIPQGNQNAAYDSGEKCTYQAPERSRTCTRNNPCQSCKSMQEQLRESNCYPQKKEKNATDNSCSKPKQQDCGPPKMQENPCPALEQAMKINRKKDHMDQLVGCTCGNNVRQKQIENLNRITQQQKTSPCCADKPSYSGQKSAGTDKRQQQMPQQCGAPPQDENVCMKGRKGAEPAPGGGSAKNQCKDQVANSRPSQFQGSCRSKGEPCYQNIKKTPKPEYEPQVKGLHVAGMTPCPAPKKTPCQVPPPAIFTRLVETPLNRCFTDDLSSASEDNCGEEDGQNAVPNMNPNITRLKDQCANDFQCDDAPADEAAGCYSSSSENGVMNKAWNEYFDDYDNPQPTMCAKIPQMVKPNMEEPYKRYCEGTGQEVNAPPNSPAHQGRFTEKCYRNRNQRCGLEQRSPGRSKCSGYDSFAEQSPGMKKFMTSTPYGGDPCPLEEVFPDMSKISENDARCNTYQKENYGDECLMQRQQFPEERSLQKSWPSAGWKKLTDQKKLAAGTPTDECRSFMSLADCAEDGMTEANQRQESGFKDSKLTRSACQNRDEKNWLGPTQDYQKFGEMRGRRGTQGPGQESGTGQMLRSQYPGIPAECSMNDQSQWTEITRRSQCNKNRKNSKQQSCPKEPPKWEESQGQDDDNSEWVEWPDNMKRCADRCHSVQKRC